MSITIATTSFGSCRTGSSDATAYRLARTESGELLLQGRMDWMEYTPDSSAVCSGYEWVTLPTVQLSAAIAGKAP